VRASAAKRNRGVAVVAQRERGGYRVVFAHRAPCPDPGKGVSGMKEPPIASFSGGLTGA